MIPRLTSGPPLVPRVEVFAEALRAAGFEGEISLGAADRITLSTDNSIYQVAPDLILFPRSTAGVAQIFRLLPDHKEIDIRPRGGGTGTNGQSLGAGVVIDASKHMTHILEIDATEGWVRVEAGVVKDQLNAALLPYGLFFAPELSTSNRATIGGMISTDACGQGSCLYGKTRDHVLELTTVLGEGTVWRSHPLADDALAEIARRPDRVGHIHRVVDGVHRDNAITIAERFPRLNRCLTGYDLAHIRDREGRFDLNAVLCGSEGTLGFIAEAKLKVLPIPRASTLVNLRYTTFDAALRDARFLIGFGPASVETIDSKVLGLARRDIIWPEVRRYFPDDEGALAMGVNIVEFVGDSAAAVAEGVSRLKAALDDAGSPTDRLGFTLASDKAVERIWTMRKKAVGLLGQSQGRARPIPFVEDTAVPPERLADYIADFRAMLDRRGLDYGMFGHVDAGVLHVRPALDLKDPDQEPLIRQITEEVIALTAAYGGLLWGEHGKGMRSEFVPRVFGPLYPCLVAIKQAFDPDDRLNPGKIASATARPLLRIDGVPLRGAFDRDIPEVVRNHYDEAMHCNGNGACFNHDVDDAMCPSWKVTRERRHSPKGRSALVREWLRLLCAEGIDPIAAARAARRRPAWRGILARVQNGIAKRRGATDFSHEVKEALDACLGCKACAGQCPIKVDVPTFRAKFLELYHTRYFRRVRDYLIADLETLLPLAARFPRLYNGVVGSALGRWFGGRLGLADMPRLAAIDLDAALRARKIGTATPETLAALDIETRLKSVVLVQDCFTRFFETALVIDLVDLVTLLGFHVWVAPLRPNGKGLQVHGFLGRFERVARANAAHLGALSDFGIPLIGLDPSVTLTYRTDYREALGAEGPPVRLVQEWLASRLDDLPGGPIGGEVHLLPHCTERTNAFASLDDWRRLFGHLGLNLKVLPSGCCGMAGTFGHEREHLAMSRAIYEQSWARKIEACEQPVIATGYSCRAQVARFGSVQLAHPVQFLLRYLRRK